MSMMRCGNPGCGIELGCGCQIRKATDGQACCTACINKYQKSLEVSFTFSAPQIQPPVSNSPASLRRLLRTRQAVNNFING
jgi:hypothetical protein